MTPARRPDAESTPAVKAASLTRTERLALSLGRSFARGPLKALSWMYLHWLVAPAIQLSLHRRLDVIGLEHIDVEPTDRVLLVSNHRSFYDQFILITELYWKAGVKQRFYFPVRSTFFYEHPMGLLINAVAGGFTMYPPFFREMAKKRRYNRASLDEASALLSEPGVLIGMHPEGTRNRGSDPYALLPPQPGVGELCHRARPKVIPSFILGPGDRFGREIVGGLLGRCPPIIVVFGAPVDLEEHYASPGRASVYKRIAETVMGRIVELSGIERARRAELEEKGAPVLVARSPARAS